MKIKTTKTVEAVFTIADLKEILSEKLGLSSEDIYMTDITKTHSEPGYDPHDAYYTEVFDGIKVTYKE